jgi:hypothetical protein
VRVFYRLVWRAYVESSFQQEASEVGEGVMLSGGERVWVGQHGPEYSGHAKPANIVGRRSVQYGIGIVKPRLYDRGCKSGRHLINGVDISQCTKRIHQPMSINLI